MDTQRLHPGWLIPEATKRVERALRPGGWVLFATVNPASDPLTLGLRRTVEWDAYPWAPAEAERALRDAGLVEIRTLPSPPTSVVAFVAGRREA
jgi:hypothetical protein